MRKIIYSHIVEETAENPWTQLCVLDDGTLIIEQTDGEIEIADPRELATALNRALAMSRSSANS